VRRRGLVLLALLAFAVLMGVIAAWGVANDPVPK